MLKAGVRKTFRHPQRNWLLGCEHGALRRDGNIVGICAQNEENTVLGLQDNGMQSFKVPLFIVKLINLTLS
jgi:hypothetical protein